VQRVFLWVLQTFTGTGLRYSPLTSAVLRKCGVIEIVPNGGCGRGLYGTTIASTPSISLLSHFIYAWRILMNLVKSQLAIAAVLVGAALVPAAAFAEGSGLTFNLGAVSLYKSNGIDQDSRSLKNFRPAVQGGVDYEFGNGLYVGNWNSTGKFGDADLEIDLYGGYRGELAKGVSYDIGFASYLYPSSGGGWNGNELYGSLSYSIFTAKLTRGTSGAIDKWSRLGLSVAQPLNDSLTLKGGMGFRNKSNGNSGAYDYSLGLAYDMGNSVSTSATVSGAQTSKSGDAGKSRLVLGVSKSF
jgi:uncharacterized protein (TIGR02001 family)